MSRPTADATPGSARAALTTDPALVVLSWGGWLPGATGITSDDACGRPLGELVPDLESRGLGARLRAVAAEDQVLVLSPALHGYLIPCPPRRPSAWFTQMQQHVVATPIRGAAGVVGVTVTLEDVTARREHFRRLAQEIQSGDEHDRLAAVAELAAAEGVEGAIGSALRDPSWRVRRAARDAFVAAGPDAGTHLLEVVRTEHRDPAALNAAIDALARRGPGVVPGLVELLRDPSGEVRAYAALALGLAGHPNGVPDLLQALGDPDVNARFHAIEALGRLRALEAGGALLTIAEGADSYLAFAALDALALIGDGSLAEPIAGLIAVDALAEPAVRALGSLGGLENLPALMAQLAPGRPARAAIEALNAIDRRTGGLVQPLFEGLVGPGARAVVVQSLDERQSEGTAEVVRVLGWLRGPEVDGALARALERPEASEEARRALVGHAPDSVPTLVGLLASDAETVRIAAAEALGETGSADAVPALIGLLVPGEAAAVAAASALKDIGDERAFEPLLALLDADDVTLRHAAVGALNSGGHPALGARADGLLAHPSARVREAAARIVGYFGGGRARGAFLALLDDPDEGVRVAAAEHLGSFEDVGVADDVARALADGSPRVRAGAARGLAQVETDVAAPLLLRAMADPKLWVRYEGARSAGRHAETGLRGRLEELAGSDPAPPVRIAALDSLGAMGSERLAELAMSGLATEESDLAFAATAAVGVSSALDGTSKRAVLGAALRSPDPRVRAEAAKGLAPVLDDATRAALIERATTDPEPLVVGAAARALVVSGDPSGVRVVLGLLADRTRGEPARAALADAPALAADAVAGGLASPDARLRLAVIACLQEIAGNSARAALAGALADASPAVRVAARRALEVRDLRAATLGGEGW